MSINQHKIVKLFNLSNHAICQIGKESNRKIFCKWTKIFEGLTDRQIDKLKNGEI